MIVIDIDFGGNVNDFGGNVKIVYIIKDGNKDGKFKIDRNIGIIYVVDDFNMFSKY